MARTNHLLTLSCLAIVLCPVQSQRYQCVLCPAGKYKDSTTNSLACVACGANTYQDQAGAVSVLQCRPCPANSYSVPGSSSMGACLCAAGYSGDVANYSAGVYNFNLARACTGSCLTMSNKVLGVYSPDKAIDGDASSYSVSDTVSASPPQGELNFVGMKPWWRVRFEREVVINDMEAIKITNSNAKMTTFSVRVGNDDNYQNMLSATLCAGPLTWPAGNVATVTCTTAVRGRYLYIINELNAQVYLSEVEVKGYLLPATDACAVCDAGSYKVASGPGTCVGCLAGKASAIPGATAASACVECPAAKYSGARAAQCVSCPNNTNSYAGSTSIGLCSCNEGFTGAATTQSCTPFQALYSAKKPWAHYTARQWDDVNKVLLDQSGNNRNTVSSGTANRAITPGETTGAAYGASGSLAYISGGVGTQLFFPAASIPAQFTICSVTRYATGVNQNRILTATGEKGWLHGHFNAKRGVALYGVRDIRDANGVIVTPLVWNTPTQSVGEPQNWLVMCSKNGGSTPTNILRDGLAVGTSNRTDADQNEWGPGGVMDRATQLCINCKTNELSDWQLANLLIWDLHLTNEEMTVVSQELLSYLPTTTACTDTVSNECVACVAGKYKTGTGVVACADCPADRYQVNPGATNANACINCPANTSAPVGNPKQTNCRCLAGYATPSGLDGTACAPCAAGSYKVEPGNGTCTLCPANTYSATAALATSACTACPANSKSAAGSVSSGNCTCLAGYTEAVGPTCVPCVSGTYKSGEGGGACTLCPNNTFSGAIGANASSTCVACTGNSTAVAGSDQSTDCHCLAGFLTLSMGEVNATCQVCSAGSYNAILGATTCSKCDAGFRSSSPGAVAREQCVGCAANLWSPAGAAQCESCPGNTTAAELSDERVDCKCLAGYYPTLAGQDGATCHACPAGTFKRWTGSAACTICPENSFSTVVAATSNATCQFAAAGAVCPQGSNDPSLCGCDRGYYGYRATYTNLARSCGVGQNEACVVTMMEPIPEPRDNYLPWHINDDGFSLANAAYGSYAMTRKGNPAWFRIDFVNQRTVTDVTFWLGMCQNQGGWGENRCGQSNNWYVSISDFESINDVVNDLSNWDDDRNLCKSRVSNGLAPGESNAGDGKRIDVTCDALYSGRYMHIYSYTPVGDNYLSFAEIIPKGYDSATAMSCLKCQAGKFKDLTGNSACTNCRANTYSNFTAARNASVCTPCYNNALAPAGSTSIWDCGCESGFEFY